jgi:NHL repeat-containing protein
MHCETGAPFAASAAVAQSKVTKGAAMNIESATRRLRMLLCAVSTLLVAATAHAAATDVAIGSPGSVATDALGNVYFSSPNVVYKLALDGTLARIAGVIQPENPDIYGGYSGDGGPATQAQLSFPLWYFALGYNYATAPELTGQLAVDKAGNVYLADALNHRVRRIGADGIITTVAGTGEKGHAGDGGPATMATLDLPQGVAIDAIGNLYISNADGQVRKVGANGTISTFASTLPCVSGFANTALLCTPSQLAAGPAGNIVTTDSYFCRIRSIAADGTLSTLAGIDPIRAPADAADDPNFSHDFLDFDPADYTGRPILLYEFPDCGFDGDNVAATDAALNNPYGIAYDAAGNLYIADTYNSCIRKVDTSGLLTTVAGSCGPYDASRTTGPGFSGDGGPATRAQISHPHGVAVGPNGTLYIADTGNSRVRKVDASGTINTIAGNGWWLPSSP